MCPLLRQACERARQRMLTDPSLTHEQVAEKEGINRRIFSKWMGIYHHGEITRIRNKLGLSLLGGTHWRNRQ